MAKIQKSQITIIQPMIMSNARSLRGTEIYLLDGCRFKIQINSDGYFSQSYVRLSKWTDNSGFEIITSQPVGIYFQEFSDAHIGQMENNKAIIDQFKTKAIKSMVELSKNFI